jgi:hypothetical protein
MDANVSASEEVGKIPLLLCFLTQDFEENLKQKLGKAYDEAVKDVTEHGIDVIFMDGTSNFGPFVEKGMAFNIFFQPGGYSKRTKEKIAQAFYERTLDILGCDMMVFFRDMDSPTGNVAEKDHLGRILITE